MENKEMNETNVNVVFNEKAFAEKFKEAYDLNLDGLVTIKDTGKKTLQYLSWNSAIKEFTRLYPGFDYEIKTFDGKPYLYDEGLGYMVMTSVTVQGKTKTMWLPVMDERNCAMKATPYKVTYKNNNTVEVKAASMFDINKSIMRCLVKNLGMFGLGLKLYSPEEAENIKQAKGGNNNIAKTSSSANNSTRAASDKQILYIEHLLDTKEYTGEKRAKFLQETVGINDTKKLTMAMVSAIIEKLK